MSQPSSAGSHRERPRRSTRQRAAIADTLSSSDRFRTAQELHHDLKRAGRRVGLTTVYRELQSLVDSGRVDELVNPSGEMMYRMCATDDHHHHLVCRSCGRSVEVRAEEVEDWATRVAASHGYSSVTHVAELYGLCSRCVQ